LIISIIIIIAIDYYILLADIIGHYIIITHWCHFQPLIIVLILPLAGPADTSGHYWFSTHYASYCHWQAMPAIMADTLTIIARLLRILAITIIIINIISHFGHYYYILLFGCIIIIGHYYYIIITIIMPQ